MQTCCLKTHRYGEHNTLSLKNSVGMVAKRVPQDEHDYMRELHNSPHQRRMIAEINAAYTPALVVLDGVEAFISGGPDQGERVSLEVIFAGTDRIAIGAVGVALLRDYGWISTHIDRFLIIGNKSITLFKHYSYLITIQEDYNYSLGTINTNNT